MVKIENPIQLAKKSTLTLFCLTFLVYQTNILMTEYLSGKTVVSLNVEKLESVAVPSFTLCSAVVLSMERASRYRPEFTKLYDDYENWNSKLHYLPNRNAENTTESERIIKEMNKLYLQVNKQIDLSTIPVWDILNNLSIPFDDNYLYFKIIFEGVFKNGSNIKTRFTTDDITLTPVHSLKLSWSPWGNLQSHKCFTIFSSLAEQWRGFEINLERIFIEHLIAQHKWKPYAQVDTFQFALHSPNTFPDLTGENFVEISDDHFYTFFYSQVNTKLLDSNYDTNCFNYDLDYKFANFNMRSDCMTSCYQNRIREECNLTNFIPSMKLLRSCYIDQSPLLKIERENLFCIEQHHIETKSTCKAECKFDCSFKYYTLEKVEKRFNVLADSFNLTIQRNSFPDIVIEYLPKTTFISFVCNFGGLMGMWLGLSVMVIFDDALSFIVRLLKRHSINLNMFKSNTNVLFIQQNFNNNSNWSHIRTMTNRDGILSQLPRNTMNEIQSPLSVKTVFDFDTNAVHY